MLNITSWDNTFENFKTCKENLDAFRAFKYIAKGDTWNMLLCVGSAGCGKTHLCESLSIYLYNQGEKCRVWEWSEVIRGLKTRMRQSNGSYEQWFEEFRRSKILIIDDVGIGGGDTNWTWGEFEDIINYRYRNNLVTVVTSNLDTTKFPDRAVSRFSDALKSRIVVNNAEDYRPKKSMGYK